MAKSTLAKRIMSDPLYERTRENMAEFQAASKSSKVFIDAFRVLTTKIKAGKLMGRLNKQMMKVLQTDSVSDRGDRTVSNGDITLLKGFEFNTSADISTLLFAPYVTSIDRATGTLKVDIAEFVPKEFIRAPESATHFSLTSAASEINFASGTYSTVTSNTSQLVYGDQTEAAISLSNTVSANSTNWLVLVFGIRFYEQVNNKFYPLHSGQHNSLTVVDINGPTA